MDYVEGTALAGASRICFGCEQLGGMDWGDVDIGELTSAIHLARTIGVNFFDTAAVYGLGDSERRLGAALAPIDDSVTIATKGGLAIHKPTNAQRANVVCDSSANTLIDGVSDSCDRLGIECIPVYLIHWPDPKTPIRKTMRALMSLKEGGKIGAIGLSNFDCEQISEAQRFGDVDIVQVSFSLLSHENRPIVDLCHKQEIAVCAYGVLAQGLLTGKYSSDSEFGSEDRRHRLAQFSSEKIGKNLLLVDRLVEFAQTIGRKPAQIAIRYSLQYAGISAVIVGIKSRTQLLECADVFDWSLSRSDIEFLETG